MPRHIITGSTFLTFQFVSVASAVCLEPVKLIEDEGHVVI